MTPFLVQPLDCKITYSCEVVIGVEDRDLCLYSDDKTDSKFDTETGKFTFQSDDMITFGDRRLVFKIAGRSGLTEASATFELNLVVPAHLIDNGFTTELVQDPEDTKSPDAWMRPIFHLGTVNTIFSEAMFTPNYK